jgi:hypothetical protein
VLAPVPAPVLVVVGAAVDHAQVGGHRRLEELHHLLVGMGVGVGRPGRVAAGLLGRGAGEAAAVLVAEGVAAGDVEDLVAPAGSVDVAGEADGAVGRMGLVGALAHGEDHLHDRIERPVRQHLEGRGGAVRPPRAGAGTVRGLHHGHRV